MASDDDSDEESMDLDIDDDDDDVFASQYIHAKDAHPSQATLDTDTSTASVLPGDDSEKSSHDSAASLSLHERTLPTESSARNVHARRKRTVRKVRASEKNVTLDSSLINFMKYSGNSEGEDNALAMDDGTKSVDRGLPDTRLLPSASTGSGRLDRDKLRERARRERVLNRKTYEDKPKASDLSHEKSSRHHKSRPEEAGLKKAEKISGDEENYPTHDMNKTERSKARSVARHDPDTGHKNVSGKAKSRSRGKSADGVEEKHGEKDRDRSVESPRRKKSAAKIPQRGQLEPKSSQTSLESSSSHSRVKQNGESRHMSKSKVSERPRPERYSSHRSLYRGKSFRANRPQKEKGGHDAHPADGHNSKNGLEFGSSQRSLGDSKNDLSRSKSSKSQGRSKDRTSHDHERESEIPSADRKPSEKSLESCKGDASRSCKSKTSQRPKHREEEASRETGHRTKDSRTRVEKSSGQRNEESSPTKTTRASKKQPSPKTGEKQPVDKNSPPAADRISEKSPRVRSRSPVRTNSAHSSTQDATSEAGDLVGELEERVRKDEQEEEDEEEETKKRSLLLKQPSLGRLFASQSPRSLDEADPGFVENASRGSHSKDSRSKDSRPFSTDSDSDGQDDVTVLQFDPTQQNNVLLVRQVNGKDADYEIENVDGSKSTGLIQAINDPIGDAEQLQGKKSAPIFKLLGSDVEIDDDTETDSEFGHRKATACGGIQLGVGREAFTADAVCHGDNERSETYDDDHSSRTFDFPGVQFSPKSGDGLKKSLDKSLTTSFDGLAPQDLYGPKNGATSDEGENTDGGDAAVPGKKRRGKLKRFRSADKLQMASDTIENPALANNQDSATPSSAFENEVSKSAQTAWDSETEQSGRSTRASTGGGGGGLANSIGRYFSRTRKNNLQPSAGSGCDGSDTDGGGSRASRLFRRRPKQQHMLLGDDDSDFSDD